MRPRSRSKRLARVALLALASAVGLVLAEAGSRLLGYTAIYDVYSKPSLLWRGDALLGWSHTPSSSELYIGPRPFPIEFRTRVEINAHGLRGQEIGPKPPGGVRILVLGDSMVAAFEVEQQETFVAVLERRLRRHYDAPIEVINGGVRGYGTDQSYLYYLHRGHALDADIVVFSHSDNDPLDNVTLHRMRRPFGKAGLRPDADGSLVEVGVPIPAFPLCSEWVLDEDFDVARTDTSTRRAACWLQTRLADHSAIFSVVTRAASRWPALLKLVNRFITVASHDRPFAVASTLPTGGGGATVASAATRMQHAIRIVAALDAAARSHDASFVFLMTDREQALLDPSWPELRALEPIGLSGDPIYPVESLRFVNDSHYTAAGHRFWAELLQPVIQSTIEARRPDLRATAEP